MEEKKRKLEELKRHQDQREKMKERAPREEKKAMMSMEMMSRSAAPMDRDE